MWEDLLDMSCSIFVLSIPVALARILDPLLLFIFALLCYSSLLLSFALFCLFASLFLFGDADTATNIQQHYDLIHGPM